MITYTVKYRKQFGFFARWKVIKKCKGDGLTENGLSRFFIFEDETRIEVPCKNTIFKFSKERFYLIKERMSQEARQDIKLNPK